MEGYGPESVQALLVLGFAIGALVYVGIGLALVRGAFHAARGVLALYWRDRARRETAATVRRVQAVAAPPPRSSERRAA
jgi:hypothetical protein